MFGKKTFEGIMSQFTQAKADLTTYVEDKHIERDKAEESAKAAVTKVNTCVDEINTAGRTMRQLDKILGE